ncbi:protein white-like isoform X2 [Tubulanus polymorphus]|uniref:protein white-like isoform X2 n=1 Tax=Tubulanus polymorphus TaxID=672921 RepID=UPI003DA210FC
MNFLGNPTDASSVISMSDWEKEEVNRRRRGDDDAFDLEFTSHSESEDRRTLITRRSKRTGSRAKYTETSEYTSEEEVGFISRKTKSYGSNNVSLHNSFRNGHDHASGLGKFSNSQLSIDGTAEKITLTWNNVNVYLPADGRGCCKGESDYVKHILKDVSGMIKPGSLLAVMGASGAGKSTLLNVLTYRNRGKLKVTGDVRVNGQRIGEGMTAMSGYVQQDDLFIGTLKVREHLWFQAMLRMDHHISYKKRLQRIEDVLLELGLMKCADSIIGIPGRTKGISGGEMKRLSFASEVLTNPPLMYCDEPTSGLDSFMAQNVIQTLKNLTAKGKTIMCTIHQPSSEVFEMFDRLLLMAEGRVVYLGPAAKASGYFKKNGFVCPMNYNPADYYVHTLAIVPGREEECRKKVDKFFNDYETSDLFNEVMDDIENVTNAATTEGDFLIEDEEEAFSDRSRYKASFWWQFYAVFWRSWVGTYRDVYVFNTRLIQTIVISLVVGLLFMSEGGSSLNEVAILNINGALFYMAIFSTFRNLMGVISVFPTEMPLYFRDYSNGMYRPIIYFTCKSLAELPIFIGLPALFVVVSYWMVGLYPDAGKFFVCLVTVIIVANTAVSFGYMISTCSSTVKIAMSLAPPLTIPLMLFGGFFLNSGSIPKFLEWLKYLSWFQYANEILVINQWDQVTSIACSNINSTLCYNDGNEVIASLNFDKNNFGWDFLYLFCLLFGYRLVAFLALLIRTKRHN